MKLEHRSELPTRDFVENYVLANRPVIVSHALTRWNPERWTAEYFRQSLGNALVQVYDDLFTLKSVVTLEKYFDRYWDAVDSPDQHVPYVRWYTKFKSVDFVWADEAFESLKNYWATPSFLPTSEYLLPYCSRESNITPVLNQFPGKGLFISARGARTRLHKDPWASDAILCQVKGAKRVVLYQPEKECSLMVGERTVDIDHPNREIFTQFSSVNPDYEDTLEEGEVLYIPAGWLHHLNCLTNSIAVTWNFVLMCRCNQFLRYLLGPITEKEREVISYFVTLQDAYR